jgi:hypothetical protein
MISFLLHLLQLYIYQVIGIFDTWEKGSGKGVRCKALFPPQAPPSQRLQVSTIWKIYKLCPFQVTVVSPWWIHELNHWSLVIRSTSINPPLPSSVERAQSSNLWSHGGLPHSQPPWTIQEPKRKWWVTSSLHRFKAQELSARNGQRPNVYFLLCPDSPQKWKKICTSNIW